MGDNSRYFRGTGAFMGAFEDMDYGLWLAYH